MSLYPAVPGHRMPYDEDGSTAFGITATSSVVTFSTGTVQALNNESQNNAVDILGTLGSGSGSRVYLGVVFPELRDLLGYYFAVNNNSGGVSTYEVGVSANTTTGLDGTWTTAVPTITVDHTGTLINYRTLIQSLSSTGVQGIRFGIGYNNNSRFATEMHVYGQPSTGSNPDSLRIYNTAGTAEVSGSYFDFGDISRGVTTTLTFQIKNISSTKTASSTVVSMPAALTDTSPTLESQFSFSTNGTSFSSTITIPTLAPGALSGPLYVKNTVSATATLSIWDARIQAVPGTYV